MRKLIVLLVVLAFGLPAYGDILVYKTTISGKRLEASGVRSGKVRGYLVLEFDLHEMKDMYNGQQYELDTWPLSRAKRILYTGKRKNKWQDTQEADDFCLTFFKRGKKKRILAEASFEYSLASRIGDLDTVAYGTPKATKVGLAFRPVIPRMLKGHCLFAGDWEGSGKETVKLASKKTKNANRSGRTFDNVVAGIEDNLEDAGYQKSGSGPVLSYVTISGPTQVDESSGAQYTCTAYYSDSSTQNVTNSATWSENSGYATISISGYLTTNAVSSDQSCTITANYGGKADTHVVTIKDGGGPVLSYITISGPTEVDESSGAQYACTAYYSDSSAQIVTNSASWSENSGYATISISGYLTTNAVSSDQSCTITANYGGKADTHVVTIKNVGFPATVVEIYDLPATSDTGTYTLKWRVIQGLGSNASTIQEDSDISFSSPTSYWTYSGERSYNFTNKPDGTYYYRVSVGGSAYSDPCSITVSKATSEPVLRVINDLYDQYVSIDWAKANTIVRVRVGPTESDVLTNSIYEKLTAQDSVCITCPMEDIDPSYNQTSSYEDFDVSSNSPDYWVFIHCGWWEFYCYPPDFTYCVWTKHFSSVYCTDGSCCCQKWVVIHVTGHTDGIFELRASDFLPHGSWNGTL
jgi:hypothetical protein